jgi:hypothetical protein
VRGPGLGVEHLQPESEAKDPMDYDTGYTCKITPKIGFSKTTKQRLKVPSSANKLV